MAPEPTPTPWRAAFLTTGLIWGASFLFIKLGLEFLAPLQVAFARCALGALALLVWVLASGDRIPRDRVLWGHMAVGGLLFCSVPFGLFAWAETEVTSIVAGIWNATTPLMTLIAVLALVPSERPTRAKVLGLLLGFVGVIVVLGPWEVDAGGPLLAQLACVGAAACYGTGFGYVRRFVSGRAESGASIAFAQLTWGAVQLAPFALLSGAIGTPSAEAGLSVLALGVLGSGMAYVFNYRVLRAAGPATASSVTYLIPLFATAFGVVLLGEGLTWHQPVGAVVVLAGVAVSQGRLARRRA